MFILKYGQYLSKGAFRNNFLPVTNRSYCDFAHRWMPGPYPKTKEEREIAAAKYNLIPEDYEPLPEDSGMGDYPKIDERSHLSEAKPYYLDYDEPFLRRNYGETMSEFHSTHDYEPPQYRLPEKEVQTAKIIWFLIVSFLIFAIFGPECHIHKAKPKQYPPEYFVGVRPKVHYEYGSTTVGASHHH